MTTHDLRNRLAGIAKMASMAISECCYTKDYNESLKKIITEVCRLGDEIEKPIEEEKV